MELCLKMFTFEKEIFQKMNSSRENVYIIYKNKSADDYMKIWFGKIAIFLPKICHES